MPALNRDLLRRLPKAELHCHLDGSLRPATLLELARDCGASLPATDAATLGEHMVVRDAHNLEEYLARFELTLAVLQHSDAIERVAYELVEDAARDGVRYIEMRFAPVLNMRGGLSGEAVVEAALRGIARGERDHGTRARIIVCALRHLAPTVSMAMAQLAVDFRDHGVVGFDLAGPERGHPAADHAAAFQLAAQAGLARTVHAGEGYGADSVRQALHACGAQRLGHATRLIEDAALMDEAIGRAIPLEICLTSNLQTRVVASYAAHPLCTYLARGCNVSLNTDNRLMSGVTLTDEYMHAHRELGLGFPALAQLALNGFSAAFLPLRERETMRADAEREIARLRLEAD